MNFYTPTFPTMTPDMDMQMMTPMYPNPQVVKVVHNCAAECFSSMAKFSGRPDQFNREMQIKLLHDCARICESQAIYTAVDSVFAKQHAAFCSVVCETCGKECAKFPDEMSQHCSRVCLHCAEVCRRYSGM